MIGPNGAGKSTLLRAVGGAGARHRGDPPRSARRATRLRRRERARVVATVAQSPVVPPGMSVFDYVLLGPHPVHPAAGPGVRRRPGRRRATCWTGSTWPGSATGSWTRSPAASGSGCSWPGRWPRARRCCCWTSRPAPWTSATSRRCWSWWTGCAATHGLTVLATMHELSIAGEYADRLVLLAGGRVVAAGPPREVLTEELLGRHYQARVRVIPGEHGPLVVPVRSAARAS